MTLSPMLTSRGTRLPLSSTRPGPIARTLPSWGFSLAVSGMTRPEAVVCSASSGLTTIRSSRGLMLTDTCRPPLSRYRERQMNLKQVLASRTPSRGSYVASVGNLMVRVPVENVPVRIYSAISTRSSRVPDDTMGRVDLEAFSWLLSAPGQALLARAAELYDGPAADPIRVADLLRKEATAEHAAAAMTQVELRHKASAKFGDLAASMYFTRDGLEQATRF